MISKDKLTRINELANKKKTEGLTAEEQAERKRLHEEYLQNVRDSLRSQLNQIHFVDEDEEMTEEEKENVAFLTNKLGQEFQEQERLKQLDQTLQGNPSNPTGIIGAEMLTRMNKSHRDEMLWGLNQLPDLKPNNILDVGCGGGAAIAELNLRYPNATIYGVDISDVAVNKTIEVNRDSVIKDQVRVSNAAAENLPFGDNFFNLVVTINTYFFWSNFKEALKQIYRVLDKKGTFLLLGDVYKGIKLSENEISIDEKYKLNLKSPEDFNKTLSEIGFNNIKIKTDNQKHWISVIATK